jgi:hypothetical protein
LRRCAWCFDESRSADPAKQTLNQRCGARMTMASSIPVAGDEDEEARGAGAGGRPLESTDRCVHDLHTACPPLAFRCASSGFGRGYAGASGATP